MRPSQRSRETHGATTNTRTRPLASIQSLAPHVMLFQTSDPFENPSRLHGSLSLEGPDHKDMRSANRPLGWVSPIT
jgi:hypothetical protein